MNNQMLFSVGFLFALISLCGSVVLPLVPVPRSSGKRDAADLTSLFGFEYYATVSLGTPAQTVLVQLDTGSSGFYVGTAACVGSGCSLTSLYDSTKSSTSSITPCDSNCPGCTGTLCSFESEYGSGAVVQGNAFGDVLTLSGTSAVSVPVVFGGLTSVTGGNFENAPVSGIWGLAYPSLNPWSYPTVLEEIRTYKSMYDGFSLCLAPYGSPVFSFGEDFSGTAGFQYSPIVEYESSIYAYYSVYMVDLKVSGVSLGFSANTYNNPTCIVDSGTTGLLLPSSVLASLLTVLQAAVPGLPSDFWVIGNCYTGIAVSSFPTLQITLQGFSGTTFDLTLTPESYLAADGDSACFIIGEASATSNGYLTILGDAFMSNYHIFFDRANTRLGFASQTTCPQVGIATTSPTTTSAKSDGNRLFVSLSIVLFSFFVFLF